MYIFVGLVLFCCIMFLLIVVIGAEYANIHSCYKSICYRISNSYIMSYIGLNAKDREIYNIFNEDGKIVYENSSDRYYLQVNDIKYEPINKGARGQLIVCSSDFVLSATPALLVVLNRLFFKKQALYFSMAYKKTIENDQNLVLEILKK